MSVGREKSVGEKLRSTHTYQGCEEVLSGWRESWQRDQEKTLKAITDELEKGNITGAKVMANKLGAITEKRFTALGNIIKKLCNPDEKLADRREIEEKIKNKQKPAEKQEKQPERKREEERREEERDIEILKMIACMRRMSDRQMDAMQSLISASMEGTKIECQGEPLYKLIPKEEGR